MNKIDRVARPTPKEIPGLRDLAQRTKLIVQEVDQKVQEVEGMDTSPLEALLMARVLNQRVSTNERKQVIADVGLGRLQAGVIQYVDTDDNQLQLDWSKDYSTGEEGKTGTLYYKIGDGITISHIQIVSGKNTLETSIYVPRNGIHTAWNRFSFSAGDGDTRNIWTVDPEEGRWNLSLLHAGEVLPAGSQPLDSYQIMFNYTYTIIEIRKAFEKI